MISQDFYLNEAEGIQNNFLFFFSTGRNVKLTIYPRSAQAQHNSRPQLFKRWIALWHRINTGEANCAIWQKVFFFSGWCYPPSKNWRQVFYLDEPETVMNSPVLWTVTENVTKQKSKALEMYFRKLCLKPNIRNFYLEYSQQFLNGSFCVKTKRNVNVCDSLPYRTEFFNLKLKEKYWRTGQHHGNVFSRNQSKA